MNSKPYPSKTNRDEQWQKIIAEWDVTRKELKRWEKYFFHGEFDGKTDLDASLLLCHPEQSISSWQSVINRSFEIDPARWDDYHKGEELKLKSFESIQSCFLGFISSYHFHPQDRAWIFTQIFGDVYDPKRLFPLLLAGETEYRKFTYDAEMMCAPIFMDVYSYLEENRHSCSYVLGLLPFVESSLQYFSKNVFSTEITDYGSSSFGVFVGLNYSIYRALKGFDTASKENTIKIELARKVKAIFDNYEGDLGDYEKLVALVEKEGPQV